MGQLVNSNRTDNIMKWVIQCLLAACLVSESLCYQRNRTQFNRTRYNRTQNNRTQYNQTSTSTASTSMQYNQYDRTRTFSNVQVPTHSGKVTPKRREQFHQPRTVKQYAARQDFLTSRIRAQNRAAKAFNTVERVKKLRSSILSSRRRVAPSGVFAKNVDSTTAQTHTVRSISQALINIFSKRNKGRNNK